MSKPAWAAAYPGPSKPQWNEWYPWSPGMQKGEARAVQPTQPTQTTDEIIERIKSVGGFYMLQEVQPSAAPARQVTPATEVSGSGWRRPSDDGCLAETPHDEDVSGPERKTRKASTNTKHVNWIKGDFDQEVHCAMSVRNTFVSLADCDDTEPMVDGENRELITIAEFKESKKKLTQSAKHDRRVANFVASSGNDKLLLMDTKPANLIKSICDPTWCPCGPPPELTNRSDSSALDQGPASVVAEDSVLDEGPVDDGELTNHKPHSALGATSARAGAKAAADGDLQKSREFLNVVTELNKWSTPCPTCTATGNASRPLLTQDQRRL